MVIIPEDFSANIDVTEKYKELVATALNSDSVYVRLKDTLIDLVAKGDLKGVDTAKLISDTLSGMASNITTSSMSTALQWAAQEKELEVNLIRLESELEVKNEQIKTAYVDRVAKDKQAAMLGLDTVMKTSNSTPETVYTPKYEET